MDCAAFCHANAQPAAEDDDLHEPGSRISA
jgi:hypothetical protein